MMVSKRFILGMLILIHSPVSHAFNFLNLKCYREEFHSSQRFISEIRFFRDQSIQGEVLSYSIKDGNKIFISGYNLFSISYHDHVISGLTGDPNTVADGVFSLSKGSDSPNGIWNFVYSNTAKIHIEAEFRCELRR